VKLHNPTGQDKPQLYTLEVFLLSGPISEKFARVTKRAGKSPPQYTEQDE